MPRKKRSPYEVDVSGFDEERSKPGKEIKKAPKKSEAKRRLEATKKAAQKRKAERELEEDDKKNPLKKKRAKRDTSDEPEVVKKAKKKLVKKKKISKTEKPTDNVEEKRAKKRKRKTAGQLLEEGKTEQARKRLAVVDSRIDRTTNKAGLDEDARNALAQNRQGIMSTENEFQAQFQHIFTTLIRISGKMEEKMEEKMSSRDVYALSTLYSQMRETMADMRSIRDVNAQAQELSTEVIDPMVQAIGEAIIGLYFKVCQFLVQEIRDPEQAERLKELMKLATAEVSTTLQADFETAKTKIADVLQGM